MRELHQAKRRVLVRIPRFDQQDISRHHEVASFLFNTSPENLEILSNTYAVFPLSLASQQSSNLPFRIIASQVHAITFKPSQRGVYLLLCATLPPMGGFSQGLVP